MESRRQTRDVVQATVIKVEGRCPVMREGDSFRIENQELPLEAIKSSNGRLCIHSSTTKAVR